MGNLRSPVNTEMPLITGVHSESRRLLTIRNFFITRREDVYTCTSFQMVSAADRSDVMLLTKEDFNRAMGWLLEAETTMPDIFAAGSTGTDARAIDEIYHFITVSDKGDGVPEHRIVNFARARVPMHSILRVIEIMTASGQIQSRGQDKHGQRWFRALRH